MYLNEAITEAPYRALWQEGTDRIFDILKDKREAELDARLLLEYVCGTRIDTLLLEPERRVSADQISRYSELIDRRCGREPLAYIVGSTDFMGLPFIVSPDVLIPEQDTENLVEEILKEGRDGERILDLCTGSGCILLSLLHYSNSSVGIGTDLSQKALDTACNFYRRIIPGAVPHLVIGGMLYMEIGFDQGEAVAGLMRKAGYYEVAVLKDYGGNDRIVRGIRSIHQDALA